MSTGFSKLSALSLTRMLPAQWVSRTPAYGSGGRTGCRVRGQAPSSLRRGTLCPAAHRRRRPTLGCMDETGPAPVDTHRKPILVAIGSVDSHDAALRFAADVAVRERRPLRLVHVVNLTQGMVASGQGLVGIADAEVSAVGRPLEACVDRARSLTQRLVRVDHCLRFGPVVSELVQLAHTADRIVLQRRQNARLSHALTGSVSADVAGLAPAPVVSVPELWSRTGVTTRLVAGVDGTAPNEAMLEWAFREAALLDAQLTLVHAWFKPSIYEEAFIGRGAVNLSRDATRLQIEQQLHACRSAFPSVDARLHVTHAQPVDALVEASRHADLLLLSRRRTRGVAHLGRMARSVLRRAGCPVGVIPLGTLGTGSPRRPRGSRAHSGTDRGDPQGDPQRNEGMYLHLESAVNDPPGSQQ